MPITVQFHWRTIFILWSETLKSSSSDKSHQFHIVFSETFLKSKCFNNRSITIILKFNQKRRLLPSTNTKTIWQLTFYQQCLDLTYHIEKCVRIEICTKNKIINTLVLIWIDNIIHRIYKCLCWICVCPVWAWLILKRFVYTDSVQILY